ncbi:hypothetical protein Tco_1380458, partial [Tanacetum coccineum]
YEHVAMDLCETAGNRIMDLIGIELLEGDLNLEEIPRTLP